MLDLKAKLAAAGVVSADQVKKFDEQQAQKQQAQKQAQQQKAERQQAERERSAQKRSAKKSDGKPTGGSQQKRFHKKPRDPNYVDVALLKQLPKGEAYDRMRKLVVRMRLDDAEKTIPAEDDQTFNFVTSKGRIGRLYLKADTVAKLREGSAAISSFMSHHGLAHCVLPKEVALAFAQIFPLWLRHLLDHPEAGKIEEPEPSKSDAPEASAKDAVESEQAEQSQDQPPMTDPGVA